MLSSSIAPIHFGRRPEFEGLKKYSVNTTEVQVEDETRSQVPVNVFHGDWLSTAIPGIADTLKVMFNHCLDRPELCHIDILELKKCIDSLELAGGDFSGKEEELITDALLWLACNWGRLWT